MVEQGRVFVLATLSMHASEVGPAQALPLLVHERLVTSDDPAVLEQLDRVVLMVVPTHNPDGMDMVVDYYRSSLGTSYEGGPLPGVYNRYSGHDNNRDFVNLTQAESRAVCGIYTKDVVPAGAGRQAPDGRHRATHVRAKRPRSDRREHRRGAVDVVRRVPIYKLTRHSWT